MDTNLNHALPDPVRPDVGGWLSGPSVSFDEIPAADVRAGDRLLLDDGTVAEVEDIAVGDFWLDADRRGPALAIGWQEVAGNGAGTLVRAPGATLCRVRPEHAGSEGWTCKACRVAYIGRRPAGDVCPSCVAETLTTEAGQ